MDSKPRFCQVASNLDSNPKIRKAGRLGREVFLFALRRNAEPGNPVTGSLPGDVLEPWFVSDQLMMSEAEACAGIEACVKANLLVRDGAGWSIVGWEEHWGSRALTNAERQARYKERQRSNVTDVTPPLPVTKVTHKKRVDKRREEEKREEKKHTRVRFAAEPDELELANAVLGKLGARTGTEFRKTLTKNHELVISRLRGGASELELRAVIAYCADFKGWERDERMQQYLQTSTLFGPENFEKYRDLAVSWAKRTYPENFAVNGHSSDEERP